ncbi:MULTISPECIES: hypothetical protein [Shewanella]|uniref:Transcriptional regulator n=1 Tax=Shewanella japonica TaxID=93973 RepID=A0ABN4YA96_9GAMM|nr:MULTISPECIES: hypothetical protein [Shewanella]ARD21323.1 hypothetical protein SJ2017_0992 [Shewanella japonica]MBQ4891501.1 hypothetical protein [Shewanella sp. MMG014]
MSSIIKLLERMGQESGLTESAIEFETAITESNLNEELKKSMLSRDIVALEKSLDICPDVVCVLFPAEEEETKEEDKKPSEDKTEIAAII